MRTSTLDVLGEHRRTRTDVLTERLVDTIKRDSHAYRNLGVVPHVDLWGSCHDNIERVLELLCEAVQGSGVGRLHDDMAYDAARETGRRRADQGLPLDDVLGSFRSRCGTYHRIREAIEQGAHNMG